MMAVPVQQKLKQLPPSTLQGTPAILAASPYYTQATSITAQMATLRRSTRIAATEEKRIALMTKTINTENEIDRLISYEETIKKAPVRMEKLLKKLEETLAKYNVIRAQLLENYNTTIALSEKTYMAYIKTQHSTDNLKEAIESMRQVRTLSDDIAFCDRKITAIQKAIPCVKEAYDTYSKDTANDAVIAKMKRVFSTATLLTARNHVIGY